MTDRPDPAPATETARAARAKRLAEALRRNLHRRKRQVRARPAETGGDDDRPTASTGRLERGDPTQ